MKCKYFFQKLSNYVDCIEFIHAGPLTSIDQAPEESMVSILLENIPFNAMRVMVLDIIVSMLHFGLESKFLFYFLLLRIIRIVIVVMERKKDGDVKRNLQIMFEF